MEYSSNCRDKTNHVGFVPQRDKTLSMNRSSPNVKEKSIVNLLKNFNRSKQKSQSTVGMTNADNQQDKLVSDLIDFHLDDQTKGPVSRQNYKSVIQLEPVNFQGRNPKLSTPENSLEDMEINDENKTNISKALNYFNIKGASKDFNEKGNKVSRERNINSDNNLIKIDQLNNQKRSGVIQLSSNNHSSNNLRFRTTELKPTNENFNQNIQTGKFILPTEKKPNGVLNPNDAKNPDHMNGVKFNKPQPTVISRSPYYYDLSNFDLLKVIGKGTFGKVILARSKIEREKYYAIKCLKKSQILEGNGLKNLKTEKSILCLVDHPFIIRLNFTFQNQDKIFMCFDYHNGGELFYHLSKERRLKENLVKFYASEIYIALVYLHSMGIMYRDIKPENIILDRNGHIKIIDFGLSKMKVDENTRCTEFCGTNEYLRKSF